MGTLGTIASSSMTTSTTMMMTITMMVTNKALKDLSAGALAKAEILEKREV